MTLEDRVQALRLLAFERARQLGNVSAACRELALSRSLFYRWKQRFERYGADGLHPRRTQARRGRPPAVSAHVGRAVIALALSWPTWGPHRLAVQLARQGVAIAPSTAYRTLRRVGLATRRERLGILEHHSARRAGLLTERTRRAVRAPAPRHVEASLPGELVCLDCFYVGKLKGVGKVWQITACDAAISFATARVFVRPQPSAEAAARFLRWVLVPLLKYLNGVLNSSVTFFWLLKRGKRLGSMLQIDTSFLLSVPIPDASHGSRATIRDKIVEVVDVLLKRYADLYSARSSADKARATRTIKNAERRLDELVFGLFDLADDEIDIIRREINKWLVGPED